MIHNDSSSSSLSLSLNMLFGCQAQGLDCELLAVEPKAILVPKLRISRYMLAEMYDT
jgi:hypothetical protein